MSGDEETETTTGTATICETLLDVRVPRKKRMTMNKKVKNPQPRQKMQSSIDVLAEVLAERCVRGSEEADDEYVDEDDEDDEEESEEEEAEEEGDEGESMQRAKEKAGACRKRVEPYKFTRCKLRNRHFLREGQGLAMIRSLGLEPFLLYTDVPRFNKSHCTEFITTYNHDKGCGVVNGRVIRITAEAVKNVTGLPLGGRGERAAIHDIRAEDLPVMDRMIPGLKRTSYGYDLRYLRYKDQTETFVAVASALSEKLVCRTFKLTYIKGAIILAMENSLRLKVVMQWAEFMAETMKSAIKLTKMRTRNVRFAFGEWLSGMIENALAGDLDGSSEQKLVEAGEAAGLLAQASGSEPGPVQDGFPLVVVQSPLQPQKFKKRGRAAEAAGYVDPSGDEVKRLQQQLLEAERRERWFVAMNLSMVREVEKLKVELDDVKGRGKNDAEMQLVVKAESVNNNRREQQDKQHQHQQQDLNVEKMMEHLERKSYGHEEEIMKLKLEMEDQRRLIELVKKSLSVPMDVSIDERSLRLEQKRLRREWEKESNC